MIASTAFRPPKLFGPAKLAVQVATCLSSALEISQSKQVTFRTSSAAVDWKSVSIVPPQKAEAITFSIHVPNPSFFWWWLWCGVKEALKENKREEFRVSLDLIGLR